MTKFPYKVLQRAHKGRPPEKKTGKRGDICVFFVFLERKMPDNFQKKWGVGHFGPKRILADFVHFLRKFL